MKTFVYAWTTGALALAAACGSPADGAANTAPAGAWTVDKAASRLAFTATQAGKEFSGEFGEFDATIVFDPAKVEEASIEVVVDMTSAKTGDRQRDAALPTGDWFSAKSFPTATFSSSRVVDMGDGAYEAYGALKIRDAARDLMIPFTLTIEDGRATADGGVTIVRTDYGVGQGEFATGQWVGLDVKVSFHIEASR